MKIQITNPKLILLNPGFYREVEIDEAQAVRNIEKALLKRSIIAEEIKVIA